MATRLRSHWAFARSKGRGRAPLLIGEHYVIRACSCKVAVSCAIGRKRHKGITAALGGAPVMPNGLPALASA